MKLSLKLALAMMVLVAALVAAAVLSIGAYLRREVEHQLLADLGRTGDMLAEAQHGMLQRLASENRVMADEPRLRVVMNSEEIDAKTIEESATEMREVGRSDLFVILGPDGAVRANVTVGNRQGPALLPALTAPILSGQAQDLTAAWPLDGNIFLVAAHQVSLGGRVAGALITGDRIDNRIAKKIQSQTNTQLALLTDGVLTAAALDEHLAAHQAELVTQVLRLGLRPQGVGNVVVAGQEYLVKTGGVVSLHVDPNGPPRGFFVMLRSLDEALITYRRIRRDLFLLGGLALLLSVIGAVALSSTLTRRVGRLASATAQVAGGDLEIAVPVGGSDEIGALGRAFNDMIAKLRISREELRTKERLERELEIATVIQTLLLPAQPSLDGFDVAARMVPAEEVGGDFYDLHQTPTGSWIAIGDVSGHGVTPGLIMMMVQSMLASVARRAILAADSAALGDGGDGGDFRAGDGGTDVVIDITAPPPPRPYSDSPREVLRVINAALYDNLRVRMHDDNYMTMVLLRHMGGGRFRFAGAHESLLLYRARTRTVEVLTTDGPWLGVQEDIGPFLQEHEVDLQPGDALLLYTDGVTEAKSPQGVQYNVDRLREALLRHGGTAMPSAQKIRDGIIDDVMAWSRSRQDDITVMVLRRLDSTWRGDAQ